MLKTLSIKAKQQVIYNTFGQYRFIRKSTEHPTLVLALDLLY